MKKKGLRIYSESLVLIVQYLCVKRKTFSNIIYMLYKKLESLRSGASRLI